MKKNNVLSSLRIETELKEKIKLALLKINSNSSGLEISLQDFRRFALKNFSEMVLEKDSNIKLKI